jgi:hypothetical protein
MQLSSPIDIQSQASTNKFCLSFPKIFLDKAGVMPSTIEKTIMF